MHPGCILILSSSSLLYLFLFQHILISQMIFLSACKEMIEVILGTAVTNHGWNRSGTNLYYLSRFYSFDTSTDISVSQCRNAAQLETSDQQDIPPYYEKQEVLSFQYWLLPF